MSYYRIGAASMDVPRYPHGMEIYRVGLIPGYVSTGEVLKAMQKLDGEIKAANSEMFLAKITDASTREADPEFAKWFLGPWSDFMGQWSRFYDNNKRWRDRFLDTNDIYNRTQQYRREYISYRDKASELGFVWGSPDPMSPEEEKHGLLSEAGDVARKTVDTAKDFWIYSLIGIAVIGGLLILFVAVGGRAPVAIPGKVIP